MACVKDNVHIKTSLCSPVDHTYKENVNRDSSETPKLNVEPQTMKRKQKDGAYDVRKSLAWDRAFLTEEGVLNPVELCMLNEGCGNNSSNDSSPTTDEEGKKFSSSFASVNDTTQVTGEFPCKLPPPGSSYKSKNDGYFSSKHLLPVQDYRHSTSVDMQKILSDRVGSRSGGYSRELVHSSLKRAGGETSEQIPMKVSKIPKIPVPRPGSHLAAKGDKANVLRGSNLKRNQSAQTDIVHGSCTTKVFSANTTSSACKANTSSLISPGRCKADQDLIACSSSVLQSPKVMNANHAEEMFPTSVLGSDGLRSLGSYYQSNGVQCSGRNILYNQGKPLKPSGLRMPSPSLGFFGQPISSAANHTSQKVIQATNIPERSIPPSLQKYKNSNYTCGKVKGKPDINIVPKVDKKVASYYCPSSEVLEEKEAILGGNEGIGECLKRKLDGNNANMCHFFECASEIGCNLGCDDIESSSIDSKLESHGLLVEQPSKVKAGHLNSAEEVSQMENHEGLIDTHFNRDVPSKGRKDLGACNLATSNSLACIEQAIHGCSNEEAERLKKVTTDDTSDRGVLSDVENNDSTDVHSARSESALPVVSRELGDLISADVDQMADERLSRPSFSGNGSKETDVDQISHDNHDSKSNEYLMLLHKNISSQETVAISQKLSLVGGSGSSCSFQDVSEHKSLLSPTETATRREEDGWSSDPPAATCDARLHNQAASSSVFDCLNKESDLCHENIIQVSVINSDVVEDSSSSTNTSEKCLRPILTVKPPAHAIPFSDEWLAAMEAAGEGILALKSGAVQNSPPNKSLPEPSPWSPVKRKSNHVVGPFDCTKFSKVVVLPPPPP